MDEGPFRDFLLCWVATTSRFKPQQKSARKFTSHRPLVVFFHDTSILVEMLSLFLIYLSAVLREIV